jgi:Na+-driven multidrug efflux pump
VGNLDKKDLAAAALAQTWFNICNTTTIGFMTAIDTFLTNSYGAKQWLAYSIWTGTSLLIVSSVTVVLSGLMCLCGPFMRVFVSDKNIANEAGLFALVRTASLSEHHAHRFEIGD